MKILHITRGDNFCELSARENDLLCEANALAAIWEKRDISNPDCWRRKYLQLAQDLDRQREKITDRKKELRAYFSA
jgi:hypothetical protein